MWLVSQPKIKFAETDSHRVWLSVCAGVGMCCSDTHNAPCVLSPRRSVIGLRLMHHRRPVSASHFDPSFISSLFRPKEHQHKFRTVRRRFPSTSQIIEQTLILLRRLPEGGHHFSLWECPRDSASHSSARKMRSSPLLPSLQLSA